MTSKRGEVVETMEYQDEDRIVKHDYDVLSRHRLRIEDRVGPWVSYETLATIELSAEAGYLATGPGTFVCRTVELKRVK